MNDNTKDKTITTKTITTEKRGGTRVTYTSKPTPPPPPQPKSNNNK